MRRRALRLGDAQMLRAGADRRCLGRRGQARQQLSGHQIDRGLAETRGHVQTVRVFVYVPGRADLRDAPRFITPIVVAIVMASI